MLPDNISNIYLTFFNENLPNIYLTLGKSWVEMLDKCWVNIWKKMILWGIKLGYPTITQPPYKILEMLDKSWVKNVGFCGCQSWVNVELSNNYPTFI